MSRIPLPPLARMLKQWLTESDNETFDFTRGLGAIAIIADIYFQALTLESFNPINFMGSIATILTIIAGADKLRDTPINVKVQPKALPPPEQGGQQ